MFRLTIKDLCVSAEDWKGSRIEWVRAEGLIHSGAIHSRTIGAAKERSPAVIITAEIPRMQEFDLS